MTTQKNIRLEHRAALPFCYYERDRDVVRLRLTSVGDVSEASVLWGDPHDFVKRSGPPSNGAQSEWVWRHTQTPMAPFFADGASGKIIWEAEIKTPLLRRLKYGFRLTSGARSLYFSERGLTRWSEAGLADIYNFFFFPFIHACDAPLAPPWVPGTVWYQIFPDRFSRGEGETPLTGDIKNWDSPLSGGQDEFYGGSLAGIKGRLGYLQELGVTGLYLTPIFASPSNHKYDTSDYYAVDQRFGTDGTLRDLVSEAHERGMRVMLDAVFNHAGSTHPFWKDVLARQENSPYRDYFHIRSFPVKETVTSREELTFDTFSWTARMPKWNTENPALRAYLLKAALKWIRECGIDAWRLDVANEVSLDFWREFAQAVRAEKKDFYIVGEIWHDASPWLDAGLFDAAMNYPLTFAINEFLLRRTCGAREFNTRLGDVLSRYSGLHNRMTFNLLDTHDTERALTIAGGDTLALRNAFLMLFFLPGSPCIYYGDEVGLEGGRDPFCRKPMIWDEEKQDRSLLRFFRALIAWRRRHAWALNTRAFRFLEEGNARLWERPGSGSEAPLTLLYAEDGPVDIQRLGLGEPALVTSEAEGNILPQRTMAVF